jgi:hypothetical protein
MPRAGVSVNPDRARHVEAWLDGSELDMFKRPSVAPRDGAGEGFGDARSDARPGDGGAPRATASPRATDATDATDAPARRTVTITGRGAERYNPRLEPGARSRPQRRRHERSDFRPDRAALWAVVLCLALVLLAATSSHAATPASAAARSRAAAPAPAATARSRAATAAPAEAHSPPAAPAARRRAPRATP